LVYTVSADAGKYLLKFLYGKERISFRTKMEVDPTFGKFNTGDSYNIDFNGKKYLVGNGATESDYDTTKLKLLHKLCIYTAIGLMCDNHDIRLISGCPISEFFNEEFRNKYIQYFMEDKNVSISINGENKKFCIKEVNVFPESIGIIFRNPEFYFDKLVGVIDIGGLNSNGAIYESLKPRKESIFTINEGGNMINSKITRELNIKLGSNYHDYEIPYLMENQDKEIRAIIDFVMKGHITKIIETAKKYDWNINRMPIYFTGGGSLLLNKYIKELLPSAIISKDPIWDNVEGFNYMGGILQCQV
jgi:plasmid segregation protein ParM